MWQWRAGRLPCSVRQTLAYSLPRPGKTVSCHPTRDLRLPHPFCAGTTCPGPDIWSGENSEAPLGIRSGLFFFSLCSFVPGDTQPYCCPTNGHGRRDHWRVRGEDPRARCSGHQSSHLHNSAKGELDTGGRAPGPPNPATACGRRTTQPAIVDDPPPPPTLRRKGKKRNAPGFVSPALSRVA